MRHLMSMRVNSFTMTSNSIQERLETSKTNLKKAAALHRDLQFLADYEKKISLNFVRQ